MDAMELSQLSGEEVVERLQKEINELQSEDFQVRQKSLEALLPIVGGQPPLKAQATQHLLEELSKPLLKRVSDSKEKCRELALQALKELLSRSSDTREFLPFLFTVLVDQLGAYDLEGVAGLPEPMKPSPSQKPQVVRNPPEPCEENRVLIADLAVLLVSTTPAEHFAPHLDELVSVLRALAMDPACPEVKIKACMAISEISRHAPQLLHHYSQPLVRSLYSSFVHKQWKVRKAAMEALGQVMFVGTFKYNAEILEELVGFRDPNIVPIKDFYEPSTKLNYFAMMVNDRSVQVREMFYSTIGEWLCRLPDKYDLESRLIPYLLSGLFDSQPDIQTLCFEAVEEVGQIYEEEKEKDIREARQFGYREPWTCDGIMADLPLPVPFAKRPRLGARLFFRQYVRRYLNAIVCELNDWISSSRIRAANLLLSLTIFSEDYMTQHTDRLLSCLYRAVVMRGHEDVTAQLEVTVRLLGRFLDAETFTTHILSNMRGDLLAETEHQRSGVVKVMKNLLIGALEALPPSEGTKKLDSALERLLSCLHEGLELSDSLAVLEIGKLLHVVIRTVDSRKQDLKDVSEFCGLTPLLVSLLIESEATLHPLSKPEDIAAHSELTREALSSLSSICNYQEAADPRCTGHSLFSSAVGEFVGRLEASNTESWHLLTSEWKWTTVLIPHIAQMAGKDEEINRRLVAVIGKLVAGERTVMLHTQALRLLVLLNAELGSETEKIAVAAMRGRPEKAEKELSKVRMEAISLEKTIDHRVYMLNPDLLVGLTDCLSDSDASVRSETLKLLHDKLVPFSDGLFTGQAKIAPFTSSSGEPTFPILIEKLLLLLDDSSQEVRAIAMLPLLVLVKTLPVMPDDQQLLMDVRTNRVQKVKHIISEFELSLVGDLRLIIQKVLTLLLQEEHPDLKEKCHEILVEVRKRNSRAIAAEALGAKSKGYLKRWEYLTVLLEAT